METRTESYRGQRPQPVMDGAVPIHDKELERTVVGTLIQRRYAMDETAEILTDDCFWDEGHKEIYRAVRSIYDRGELPDVTLVSTELRRNGTHVGVGEVVAIAMEAPVVNLVPHALVLRDMSVRRQLFEAGTRVRQAALDETLGVDEVYAEAKESLDGIFGAETHRCVTLEDTYRELQEHILANMGRPEGLIYGTPTGFPELDRNGGLCGSDLTVIGAETSQGKTSLAMALTVSALANGVPVAFYSMEMTPQQLTARIAAMVSGVSSKRQLYDRLEHGELQLMDAMMDGLDRRLLHIDDRATSTVESISMSIRGMVRRHGVKGAVIDYLQLMKSGDRRLNQEQTAAHIARSMKNLAKELDIWIVLISQLRRDDQNPVPTMSRLRDSGQIEEAADNILLIYRPRDGRNYPAPFTDVPTQHTALVKMAKGRNVGTTEFICGFKGETTLFYPLEAGKLDQLRQQGSIKAVEENDDKMPF